MHFTEVEVAAGILLVASENTLPFLIILISNLAQKQNEDFGISSTSRWILDSEVMFKFISDFRLNSNKTNNIIKRKAWKIYNYVVLITIYFCNLLVSTFRIGLKTVCAPSEFLAASKKL